MPNHITNIIHPVCDEKKFMEIAECLRRDNGVPGSVDFSKIIPMPEALDIEASSRGEAGRKMYEEYLSRVSGITSEEDRKTVMEEIVSAQPGGRGMFELGRRYSENIRDYGHPTWYSWCIENWGTKWNAYDCAEVAEGDTEFRFQTAWSGVPEIVSKISEKFPGVRFEYSYADEDIGRNCGRYDFENGRTEMSYFPGAGTRDAYELAAGVMDMDLEENGFVLSEDGSTYVYDCERDEGYVPSGDIADDMPER